MSTFKGIKPGDRVTFVDSRGIAHTGRAQLLLCFHTHVVVNMGGRYGTPAVVNATNYRSHRAPGPIHRGLVVDVTPEEAA